MEHVRAHAGTKVERIAMTTAEKLLAEGRAEGEAKGRAEGEAKGRAEALLKVMRRRFFQISPSLEAKVSGASLEELDRWIERAVDAERPEDVFE